MIELNDILSQVYKPGRYIGQEWNVAKKDFEKAEIKFALCFPDLYEVGMSNLGLRILYGLLNNIAGVCCERFFSPEMDMESLLRNNHMEISSLENKKSLRSFDLVGFSIGYELDYTNILNILDLSLIPLKSSLRDDSYPLIIGGGPCTLNPEPLHDFFDLFVIGEAEEAIVEIIEVYRKYKSRFKAANANKQELLLLLANIEGVYVPSFYDVKYNYEGKIVEFKPKFKGVRDKIKKRFVRDLDNAYFPLDWLVPFIAIVHDRITLEVMRGCPNHCNFCQARAQYFPFRLRDKKNVLQLATDIYKRTGYDEISLSGLSVSDYPQIEQLLGELVEEFKDKAVSVSLPSIKPKAIVGNLSALIVKIKKTGFTFAPEAATEKLRKVLNKDFQTPDLFKAIENAYSLGWQHIKLYFMIGIPYEEEKDLDAILDFSAQASGIRKKVGKGPAQVNISVNALIPKPHTPFQWLKMEDLDIIRRKQAYLRKRLKNKRLKLSFHNPHMSFLEGVFSRGDRRLSEVILAAFKKGARFDAWDKYFNFDLWLSAFSDSKIDHDFYLKNRPENEILPWDFLDTGVDREILAKEYKKIVAIN